MEIKPLTKQDYDNWNQFCLDSDDTWWYNTTHWLEYTLNYKPENKPESKSFMILENNKIMAICSLIKEKDEFSFGNDYGPTPAFNVDLTRKERNKYMKAVFKHIDELAKDNNIKRIRMRFPVLNHGYDLYNYLTKFGFIDTSINTRLIDLSCDLEDLRREIRHGHDSDIDKASRVLGAEIYDKENIGMDIFNKYKHLHFLASGRQTRPDKTFELIYEWIKQGNGFLIGALLDDEFVSFSYFTVYKNNVNYGSSCNKPNIDLPLAHLVQWVAIKYMSYLYDFYELGWQYYGNTLTDFPSKKEINISRFKRGFGGFTQPMFRGEKFYDKDYFLQVYSERIKKYSEFL